MHQRRNILTGIATVALAWLASAFPSTKAVSFARVRVPLRFPDGIIAVEYIATNMVLYQDDPVRHKFNRLVVMSVSRTGDVRYSSDDKPATQADFDALPLLREDGFPVIEVRPDSFFRHIDDISHRSHEWLVDRGYRFETA
jgi:hypothetical protein